MIRFTRAAYHARAIHYNPPMALEFRKLLEAAPSPAPWYSSQWYAPDGLAWTRGSERESTVTLRRGHEMLIRIPMYVLSLGGHGPVTAFLRHEAGKAAVCASFDTSRDLGASGATAPSVKHSVKPIESWEIHFPEHSDWAECPAPVSVDWTDELIFRLEGLDAQHKCARVCIWQPPKGRLRVIPLRWFNNDTVDLGYQWIT